MQVNEEAANAAFDDNGNAAKEITPRAGFRPGKGRFRKGRATQTPKKWEVERCNAEEE